MRHCTVLFHMFQYSKFMIIPLYSFTNMPLFGEQECPVVKALVSHQCGPGSIPGLGVICGLSLLLVLYNAPRGFSPGTPVFPSSQKPTFPNSNSIWNARTYHERAPELSGVPWVNKLHLHLFFLPINISYLIIITVIIVLCTCFY